MTLTSTKTANHISDLLYSLKYVVILQRQRINDLENFTHANLPFFANKVKIVIIIQLHENTFHTLMNTNMTVFYLIPTKKSTHAHTGWKCIDGKINFQTWFVVTVQRGELTIRKGRQNKFKSGLIILRIFAIGNSCVIQYGSTVAGIK